MRLLRLRNLYISRRLYFLGIIVVLVIGAVKFLNPHRPFRGSPMVDSSRHLPLLYWHHRSMYPQPYRDPNCTRAPSPRRVKHAYPFWQLIKTINSNVIASSAFWDDRFASPAVRILVYADRKRIDGLFCQLWYQSLRTKHSYNYDRTSLWYFNRKDPIIVQATATYAWREFEEDAKFDEYYDDEEDNAAQNIVEPFVVTCTVTTDSIAPAAVSLVTDRCAGATNLLRVQGAPLEETVKDQLPGIWTAGERIRNVLGAKGVCVCAFLPPHSHDVSARLAEWIELLKHFGVEMIYLYVTLGHYKVRRVIDHYQMLGLVDVSFFSIPFEQQQLENQNKRPLLGNNKLAYRKKQQVIYNDCLYRSLGWHQWIAPMRLDDLIVPIRDGNLVKLAERELEQSSEPPDAFSFSAFRFFPRETDSNDLKMVDHQWRLNESFSDDWNVRCMNSIDTVIILQEYLPLWCAGGRIRLSDGYTSDRGNKNHLCHVEKVDPDAARVHSYGSTCKGCRDLVRDTRMQRWRDVGEETDYFMKELLNDRE